MATLFSDEISFIDAAVPQYPDPMVAFDTLLDRVWRKRFTTFLAIQGEIDTLCPDDPVADVFLDDAAAVLLRNASARRALVEHPTFNGWLWLTLVDLNHRLVGTETDEAPLRARLASFAPMLARVDATPAPPTWHCREIDPIIAETAPPSYENFGEAPPPNWHSVEFFGDIVDVALDRITETWPAARTRFNRLVRAIAYLPDADFRSCSASRFVGVILISARDQSLLDLEESLVHECAHQHLYHIVEDAPVTDADTEIMYSLPWSGQMRELYGYFHAFFVYVELSHYYERVLAARPRDKVAAQKRLVEILLGLRASLADFTNNPGFTPSGRELFIALSGDVAALLNRHRKLMAS